MTVSGDTLAIDPLSDPSLPSRVRAVLKRYGVRSVAAMAMLTEEDILMAPNSGDMTVIHVQRYLDGHGLSLALRPSASRADPLLRDSFESRLYALERRVYGLDVRTEG